jgi:hypothetical protein
MARRRSGSAQRVTVTLDPAQKEVLQQVADANRASVAFVVRWVIDKYIEDIRRGQLELHFPEPPAAEGGRR